MLKKLKKLKKAKQICILFPVITLNVALSSAGQTTEPFEVRRAEAAFEELPVLNASEILRPEFLAGPHHKVREPVPTYFGVNQFTIDSDFGVFEANGNEMLIRRINEINAIAKLKEVSRSDEFKNALRGAAKAPVAGIKNIASDPANTISNAPKGVMKFMSRAGESLKGVGKKNQSTSAEGSTMQQLIG